MSIMGLMVIFIIMGIAGMFLFSTTSGAVSLRALLGVGGASGFVGSILAVFTDAWSFVLSSLYGGLGLYGWIFIFGLGMCLVVWTVNAIMDMKLNRPISFVD